MPEQFVWVVSRGIKGLYLKADKFDEGGQDLVTEVVEMEERGRKRKKEERIDW